MEGKVNLAIAKANRALDPSDKGNQLTANELESAADELWKTVKSAGLAESHPLVVTATDLGTSLRNKCSLIQVSALHAI